MDSIQISVMNKQITKYLLLAPLSYIAYCYYQSQKERIAREKIISKYQTPDNLNYEYSRFNKCQSSIQLAHVLKKSLKHIRANITWPTSRRPEIEDCQVIDTSPNINFIGNSHYHTRAIYRINKHNYFQTRKEGYYNIICWTNREVKQQLKLQKLDNDQIIIKQILDKRQGKCIDIAKHSQPTSSQQFQKYFIQCYRKTQGAGRLLQKELDQIQLIKQYKQYL